MHDRRRAPLRPAPRTVLRGRGLWTAAIVMIAAVACATSPSPTTSPSASLGPTPSPTPTPQPTPRFSNEADPALSALIPDEVTGLVVVKPAITDYAITPGDIGQTAYGELGARFQALVIAFIREPRLSLYAMRVDGPITTEELEPYLATAGRYVGISGLDPEPWELTEVGGHWVWVRPSDNATLPGTQVYTWAVDDVVFLMIGVSSDLNQALLALLPGEPPPTPSPAPSTSPGASEAPDPSASPSGS
ncbi:MAG TPA: hypothetical protein VGO32_07215 [Candidatus Limnocylindria bacterium]|nr:hypothetical protein [Candidatus Limnocylindria bacterium]